MFLLSDIAININIMEDSMNRFNETDKYGNKIWVEGTRLFLQTSSSGKARFIGTIEKVNNEESM